MREFQATRGMGPIDATLPNGRELTIPVVAAGAYTRAVVQLDIKHSRLADLTFVAFSPDGKSFEMQRRTGRGSVDGLMAFELPVGDVVQWAGDWRVRVLDLVAGDGGELRGGSLELYDSSFLIDLKIDGYSSAEERVMRDAVARWQSIIKGLKGVDAWTVVVDCQAIDIDGAGGVLGQSGPTQIDLVHNVPKRAILQLDKVDTANLLAAGLLLPTATHELGHGVAGIGTVWSALLQGYYFTGAGAGREYAALGGRSAGVPVEDDGGPGTALGHWEEDVFGDELMTGWIDPNNNPLSRTTAACCSDLGWIVNMTSPSIDQGYKLPTNRVRSLVNGRCLVGARRAVRPATQEVI